MTKYNITLKKEKKVGLSYRNYVKSDFVEDVARKIISKLMIEGKYRDPNYSAQQLAKDIGVNMRQISAVTGMRFQMNYSELVGTMRIQEAKYMLGERHFANMTMEDIAINVGFATRQSFYATFYRICGTTPNEYRQANGTGTKPVKKKVSKTSPAKEKKKTK